MEKKIEFKNPSLVERIKSMLSVDFYRLFHTPLFYIFLGIAAIIPAMVSAMTMMPDQNGNMMEPLYSNVWQIMAAKTPLYVINTIADYANMNMVFIFGGIMVSIFIGHDYKSGYVKQLFTTHAKKQDYMISKSLVCAFAENRLSQRSDYTGNQSGWIYNHCSGTISPSERSAEGKVRVECGTCRVCEIEFLDKHLLGLTDVGSVC